MNHATEGAAEGKPSNSFSKASFVATSTDKAVRKEGEGQDRGGRGKEGTGGGAKGRGARGGDKGGGGDEEWGRGQGKAGGVTGGWGHVYRLCTPCKLSVGSVQISY